MFQRILLGGAAVVALAVLVVVAAVELRWDRTFQAPASVVHTSTDPGMIERGRELAYGPGHCAYCHVSAEELAAVERGERPPLAGGRVFALPVGTWVASNLTPDPETGIGRRTDAELYRILRHGVRHDGRAAFPVMEF